MGAILKLDKMPSTCRECPFASENVKRCAIRGSASLIIAGDRRRTRMPLCPLQNEREYLTKLLKSIHNPFWRFLKRYQEIEITLPKQTAFTESEQETYSKVLSNKSVDIGINILNL